MSRNKTLIDYPPIPSKVYFSIGEVSKLCHVEQHVLRYWEKVFAQLNPSKRSGNRRAYTRNDIELIRRINDLVHQEGYTLEGAKRALSGNEANDEKKHNRRQIREIRVELESILRSLK